MRTGVHGADLRISSMPRVQATRMMLTGPFLPWRLWLTISVSTNDYRAVCGRWLTTSRPRSGHANGPS